ncbi:lamin tail domain-containing protein [Streptomyces cellostaticus]|uniref:lamin tail domain-containing protein n=1 Tax=Streptomyces cellostaticus TaxID=67285 RepID=UPI0020261ECB|nr:lamin tail domain-containing protein [Streptomyces cellostaticus]
MTARRAAAATVAAAAVVGAAALPASAADHGRALRAQVVISAVQHGSHVRDARALNREWVELANEGRRDVNLNGWTLSDADGHRYVFRYYRLRAHGTVRVHTGVGRDRVGDVYQDRGRQVWDYNDTAVLRDSWGRYVDSASWGNHRRGRWGNDRNGRWFGGLLDHRGDRRHDDRDHRGDRRHDDRDHRGDRRHDDRDHRGDRRHDDRDHRGDRRHDGVHGNHR